MKATRIYHGHPGYPAYAGIDRNMGLEDIEPMRLPRIRGDRPHHQTPLSKPVMATPHTRGSTTKGIPDIDSLDGLPRIRGDRP